MFVKILPPCPFDVYVCCSYLITDIIKTDPQRVIKTMWFVVPNGFIFNVNKYSDKLMIT